MVLGYKKELIKKEIKSKKNILILILLTIITLKNLETHILYSKV